jgi:hypothetical protein
MPMESYHVQVASHLSPSWQAVGGVAEVTNCYDCLGRPITELLLQIAERNQVMQILSELHAANVAILKLKLLRRQGQP